MGFPGSSAGTESACNEGGPGSILGWEDPIGRHAHPWILLLGSAALSLWLFMLVTSSSYPNRSPQAAEAEDTGVGAGGEEFGTRESRGNPLRGGNLDPGKLSSEV